MRLLAALLATAFPLAANGLAQVLPAGNFAARDGRPGPGKHWTISDTAGPVLAAQLSVIAAKTPISIDYEHQTLLAATNGQPAPAAGWMVGFEWRAGEGLFAKVNWTPRAKAFIDGNEYRYISPVILYDALGNVTGLHNAALVSTPAILGMDAVEAALSAGFNRATHLTHHPKAPIMDLAVLIALLCMAPTSSLVDVTAHLTALMAKPLLPAALCAQLGLQTNADEAAALAALTKKLGTPDAATLQMVQALQTEVATLSAQANGRVVQEIVDGAITAHKLLPAQRAWALQLGAADIAQLNAYIAATPPIPGRAGQVFGRQDNNPGALSAKDLAAKAGAYSAAQLAAGVNVNAAEAVAAVMAGRA